LEAYLTELREIQKVRSVDGRTWLEDADFSDEHHLLRRGADVLTKRLGNEVIAPLVRGRFAAGVKHRGHD
jgi:hypothetical protein